MKVLAMALATVLVTASVTALATPMVTVAENFEFLDFFLVWVFDDEPTVPFLELINGSFFV